MISCSAVQLCRTTTVINLINSHTTERSIPTFPVCFQRLDVVFVMDDSGSIEEVNFNKMKSFVATIIRDMDIENGNIKVGVLTFSSNARLQFHLNKYRYIEQSASVS